MRELDLREMVPPQNLEAEQSVLGCALIDRAGLEIVADMLAPEDFYRDAHATIYRAALDIAGRNEPVDIVTLSEILRTRNRLDEIGGVGYLATLYDIAPSAANAAYYAQIVSGKARMRRLIEACERIKAQAYVTEDTTLTLDEAETLVLAIGQTSAGSDSHVAQVDRTEKLLASGVFGEPWAMACLNETAGPIPDEAPTVIGGLSSHGKSWMVVGETMHKCKQGLGVLGFSMEMRAEQMHQRILSHLTGIPLRALRAGAKHPATSWVKDGTLKRAIEELRGWNLVLEDQSAYTVEQMAARIRRVKRDMAQRGVRLALVWIDQASFIHVPQRTSNEYQKSKIASNGVREMVKAMKVPTLVLSQVTEQDGYRSRREPDQFPRVRTRDAQDWKNDAGCLIWLHRPAVEMPQSGIGWEEWRDKALIWVNKTRMEGGECQLKIGWDDRLGGFYDPGNVYREPEPDQQEYEYGDPLAED